MKSLIVLLALSFGCIQYNQAQVVLENVDSIKVVLSNTKIDSVRANLLTQLGSHYNVVHLDSARSYLKESVLLSKNNTLIKQEWRALNTLGVYHERKAHYDSAYSYLEDAKEIVDRTNDTDGVAVVYNNLATVYIRQSSYDNALKLLFQALEAEEMRNDKNGIAQAFNNIGACYFYLRDYEKAADYLTRNLILQEQLGNEDGLINGYGNVAAIQNYNKDHKGAIESYKKALSIANKIGDVQKSGNQLSNIGLMYYELKDYDSSQEYFDQVIKLRDSINDIRGIARTYAAYSKMLVSKGEYGKAESLLDQAKKLAEEKNYLVVLQEVYGNLSEIATAKSNYKLANEHLRRWISISDSLSSSELQNISRELETKYQTEKKEKEILSQRAQLAEKELEVRKKNNLAYGLGGGALLLGLLGYLFYNQQRLKNRQQAKEFELEKALVKIETQNKLQEQRLRISRDLHDNIGSQLTFITSSLDNLKYGMKKEQSQVKDKLTDIGTFTKRTINELRDTIWAMNKEAITLEDLEARLGNLLDQARTAAPKTQFVLDFDKEIDRTHKLTSVEGMNIYRIIQEGVNNAIKYAEASEVAITLSRKQNELLVQVKDNGKGFDTSQPTLSNGLNNMKKRAKDIGASYSITSQEGIGTAMNIEIGMA